MKFFISIYDYFRTHKRLFWGLMILCFVLLGSIAFGLDYKEDISDFLPLTTEQQQSMNYYQRINKAEQIIVIFEGGDIDTKLEAVDRFAELVTQTDIVLADNLTTRINLSQYLDNINFVYQNIPYFLDSTDYDRIEKLLSDENYIKQSIANCHRIMQIPISGFAKNALVADPLSLFAPVVGELSTFQPASDNFTSLDGYMLTSDEHLAFAFITSPYGSSETRLNTQLIDKLDNICKEVENEYTEIDVRLLGAPVIAVKNASRIKQDSVLSVALALILIVAILLYYFRKDMRAIPLIMITILFGWLFGMAMMQLLFQQVSIIVLGICSIIIGIAVNYPLHILFHQRYTTSTRQTLQEVLSPLIIGNITTVGAFLALVPLDAVALRDLGVFAASMLVGTLLFTIVFLPQLMKVNKVVTPIRQDEDSTQDIVKNNSKLRYWATIVLLLITLVLGYLGRNLSFDADISNINYMTAQQRADFAYFTALAGQTNKADIYIVEDINDVTNPNTFSKDTTISAIHSVWRWLPSKHEQTLRLELWKNFCTEHRQTLIEQLHAEYDRQGFNSAAFQPFDNLLTKDFEPQEFSFFIPLADNILKGYWLQSDSMITLVTRISVDRARIQEVESKIIDNTSRNANVFDIYTLNSSLARQLSDNFDYIGLVCSILVFVFLWLSFRSIRTAIVAFVPMAISWVWIMGIMNLFGLQFNIVNVILATFIFGQGDDYSIFVVEGLQYEHQTGKRMLKKFRQSIILSALIMFAGIGVLIFAKHPAMFSLGAVTLIGMGVVVLLANIIPPLFRWLLFMNTNSLKR